MVQPFTEERFVGDCQTAWLKHGGETTALKTRACSSLAGATLFTTDPALLTGKAAQKYQAIEKQVRLNRYGVDCYAFAMLAAGHVDIVIEDGLKPFDIAALIPIIEGAGGCITTWDGGNPVDGGAIVASLSLIHI